MGPNGRDIHTPHHHALPKGRVFAHEAALGRMAPHPSWGRAVAPLNLHPHKRKPLADSVQDPEPLCFGHRYRGPVRRDPGGQGVTIDGILWYAQIHRNFRQSVVLPVLNGESIGYLDDKTAGVLGLIRTEPLNNISMPSRYYIGNVGISAQRGVFHRIEYAFWARPFDKPFLALSNFMWVEPPYAG